MRGAPGILFLLFIASAQMVSAQAGDSLYLQTKTESVVDLVTRECGPDFCLYWNPPHEPAMKKSAYLVFVRRNPQTGWQYFLYVHDTCFVHYGAALFYPEITYEIHGYYGSLRTLPGYPRNPQDPRVPGEAIRSFWESPFFNLQKR
jgi:hypothetical protein